MPLTYSKIAGHPGVLDQYKRRMVEEGVVSEEEVEMWVEQYKRDSQAGYEAHKAGEFSPGESGDRHEC